MMEYYVYIIQSDIYNSYYKGYSTNPLLRLERHNNKESNYTSKKVPWKLVYLELYTDKTTALKRENAEGEAKFNLDNKKIELIFLMV